MQLQPERNTTPQVRLREELHHSGLHVAVFLDGCFWHGGPKHGQRVHDINRRYWPGNIAGPRERDSDTDWRQEDAGWRVIRNWEQDDVEAVASRNEVALRGIVDKRGRQ